MENEEDFEGSAPREIQRSQTIGPREKMRGVGEIYSKTPIACVVELMKRAPILDAEGKPTGKWKILPPFSGKVEGSKWAFCVMTPTTTTVRMAGSRANPAREPHPDFAPFNSCAPDLAAKLSCTLVHFDEEDAWNYFLGAFQNPPKEPASPKGKWWCRGDGKRAVRYINGKETSIQCPGQQCEFQQKAFGRNNDAAHCKPKTTFIGQFNWKEGSPLPRTIFEWRSNAWSAVNNVEAVFALIKKTASNFGMEKFPVFGLPITLNVKETNNSGKGQKYPEVHASVDGDIMQWMGKIQNAIAQGKLSRQLDEGPPSMRMLPPGDMTQSDVDEAAEINLNPNYRPSNQRE